MPTPVSQRLHPMSMFIENRKGNKFLAPATGAARIELNAMIKYHAGTAFPKVVNVEKRVLER